MAVRFAIWSSSGCWQWSGWYDLILVGFDELAVLGRAEHCPSLDHALALLDERCRVVGARLAGDEPPARKKPKPEREDQRRRM